MKEEKKNDINKIKSKFNIVVPFLFAAFNHSSYQPSQSFFFFSIYTSVCNKYTWRESLSVGEAKYERMRDLFKLRREVCT